MSATTSARTLFVMGREVDGNREAVILESGDTYDMDYAAITTYDDADSYFPYSA